MEYDNTDTIVLFKHEKKGNEKAPDYSGKLFDANGKERRVAVWLREGKSGVKFMSGKVEDLRDHQAAQQPSEGYSSRGGQATAQPKSSFDDLPF